MFVIAITHWPQSHYRRYPLLSMRLTESRGSIQPITVKFFDEHSTPSYFFPHCVLTSPDWRNVDCLISLYEITANVRTYIPD